MSLSVVFSSKKINPEFVETIRKSSGVHKIEILPYENPGKYSNPEHLKIRKFLDWISGFWISTQIPFTIPGHGRIWQPCVRHQPRF